MKTALVDGGGALPGVAIDVAALAGEGIYRLDHGDRVRVVVHERADLTGVYSVNDDGQISLPEIGRFNARGLTTSELEKELAGAMRRQLQRQVFLIVEVVTRRPFFVVGLVSKPGAYSFVPGMTVMHALAFSGGFTGPSSRPWAGGELSREQSNLREANAEAARLLITRERLMAEINGRLTFTLPPQLAKFAKDDLIGAWHAREMEILKRDAEVLQRDAAGFTSIIELKKREVEALVHQLNSLDQQRAVRAEQLSEYQGLQTRGLTPKKNVTESELAISLLERDTQSNIASTARAKGELAQAERNRDMVALERKAKIELQLSHVEESLAKANAVVERARKQIELLAGLPATALAFASQPAVEYEIFRRGEDGRLHPIRADELTQMQPGDVLRVRPQEIE